MAKIARKILLSPPVTIGGAVMIGVLEFFALQRAQARTRARQALNSD